MRKSKEKKGNFPPRNFPQKSVSKNKKYWFRKKTKLWFRKHNYFEISRFHMHFMKKVPPSMRKINFSKPCIRQLYLSKQIRLKVIIYVYFIPSPRFAKNWLQRQSGWSELLTRQLLRSIVECNSKEPSKYTDFQEL